MSTRRANTWSIGARIVRWISKSMGCIPGSILARTGGHKASVRHYGGPMAPESNLQVAVTGPTGTFGLALIPLLEDDERISRVVGIARRPFAPEERGWHKLEYRQGDVRDP